MLSPYKSAVKRFFARDRIGIKQLPPHMTILEHRSRFLEIAVDLIFREAVTEKFIRSCSHHTDPYHVMALHRLNMAVGE